METKSKEKEFEEKIKSLVTEFAEKLKNGTLLGYSFYDTSIEKTSDGLIMKSSLGLRILLDGESANIGVDLKFERGTNKSKPREYAKIYVEYERSCGRDFRIQYHDECSNTPGNSKSINDIKITEQLYKVVYSLTSPIFEESPMPAFVF